MDVSHIHAFTAALSAIAAVQARLAAMNEKV